MYMLYAWAAPVLGPAGRLADHTWVTSEAKVINNPPPKDYWYCTGAWRATATPAWLVGQQQARSTLARCLDVPNVHRSWYGGMPCADLAYGIDGTCHQIANRILAATMPPTPLTLDRRVHGYKGTQRIFGTYGRNKKDWLALIRERCGVTAPSIALVNLNDPTPLEYLVAELPDLDDARRGEIDVLLRELSAIDATTFSLWNQGALTFREYASRINESNYEYMVGLARILSPEEYERVMGSKPGERIDLL